MRELECGLYTDATPSVPNASSTTFTTVSAPGSISAESDTPMTFITSNSFPLSESTGKISNYSTSSSFPISETSSKQTTGFSTSTTFPPPGKEGFKQLLPGRHSTSHLSPCQETRRSSSDNDPDLRFYRKHARRTEQRLKAQRQALLNEAAAKQLLSIYTAEITRHRGDCPSSEPSPVEASSGQGPVPPTTSHVPKRSQERPADQAEARQRESKRSLRCRAQAAIYSVISNFKSLHHRDQTDSTVPKSKSKSKSRCMWKMRRFDQIPRSPSRRVD